MRINTKTGLWLPTTHRTLTIDGDGSGGAAGGDGATNGAGGGDGAVNGAASGGVNVTHQPNWAQFTESLERLNETMGGKLDTLVTQVGGMTQAVTNPPAAASEPPDLEAMSRAELVAHIVGSVSSVLEQQIKASLGPVLEQVQQVQTTVATTNVTEQVAKMQGNHKDFNEWKVEMVELAKQHPTLNIPQLYNLARGGNPAKAGELDKKYAPPVVPAAPRFGGLTAAMMTNGSGVTKLSPEAAGREAYAEVSARHPGILRALETL